MTANNPNYLLPYTSAFDLQSSTSNLFKLIVDWNPAPLLGLSFEGKWAKQDFDDVTYGRKSNDRQGYFLSGNWGNANRLMLTAFGSWEETKYPSGHRYIGTVAGGPTPPPGFCTAANPNCYSPTAAPNSGSSTGIRRPRIRRTWSAWHGLAGHPGADAEGVVPVRAERRRSDVRVAIRHCALRYARQPCRFGNPLNIGNFDNSKQQSFQPEGDLRAEQNWSFTAGYAYEKYDHNDIATDGYQYTLPYIGAATPTASLSYLNGYDAFTNGNQNIFYLQATYKFDAPPLPIAPLKVAEAPPKAAPPPPPPAPPPPAPAPAPQVQKITLDSKVLFDFDKAVLKPEGKAAIDAQVVGKLAQVTKLDVVLVTGHTDRIGTEKYNQGLSERRADAVRDYLVSKGVDKAKIETIGLGEKQPLVQCDQKNRKDLIACLQPNRRVEVEVKGEAKK